MKVLYVAWMMLALIVAGCANEAGGESADALLEGSQPLAGCAEAFGELDAEAVTQAFDEESDALDDTIAACDSVEEWQTFVTQIVGDIPADEQLTFIEGRCRANPELANVNACPDARES